MARRYKIIDYKKTLKELERKVTKDKLFTKEGKPRCITCGKPMVNDINRRTEEIDHYLWKHDCNCCKNKNLRLCTL